MSLTYRSEIDGLRAIAIIPVLLFHAGIPGFSGGFVGVDVFFVISGYLIGGQIIHSLENNLFSFADFYFRRARRILPAFLLVLFVSVLSAWLVLHPVALVDFSWNALASIAFVSNIELWLQSGYFDSAAELKPLLHTWSLSIEEQFYLVAPLTIFLVYQLKKNALLSVILMLALASFLIAQFCYKHDPAANFYLLPSRVWELLVGVGLAAREIQRSKVVTPRRFSTWFAGLGLAAILFSVASLDSSVRYPGVYALLPVLGTAMVIWFARSGVVAHFLGTRGFVGIGLLSYSLYLWHQPLLAFTRDRFGTELGLGVLILLLIACFVLAFLTWKYVEQPFRRNNKVFRWASFRTLILAAIGVASISYGAIITEGAPTRYSDELLLIDSALNDKNPYSEHCHLSLGDTPKHPIVQCQDYMAEGGFDVLLMGDSHSNSISYQVQELLKAKSVSSYAISYSSCIGIIGFYPPGKNAGPECNEHNERLIEYAKSVGAKSIVITSSFLSYYRHAWFNFDEVVPLDVIERLGQSHDAEENRKARMLDRLEAELTKLTEHFDVYLLDPAPRMPESVPVAMKRALYQGKDINALGISKYEYLSASEDLLGLFSDLGKEGIKRVLVADSLCPANICISAIDGYPMYYDSHHLTNSLGAKIVAEQVVEVLGY